MAISKRTTAYYVTVKTVAGDTYDIVTDSDAAYTAMEDYKAKRFVKVPYGDGVFYIPYHSIAFLSVETSAETREINDDFCKKGDR